MEELQQQLDQLANSIGQVNLALLDRLGNALIAVGARYEENRAGVTQSLQASADAVSAVSAAITSIFATTPAGTAQGFIRFVAVSEPAGVLASFAIEINAGTPNTPDWKTSGFYMDVVDI
jgi:hypothetical protein